MDAVRLRFLCLVALLELIGAVAIVLTAVWAAKYLGGLSWSGDTVFNSHPVLMVAGPVVASGSSTLLYRAAPARWRLAAKVAHACLQLAALAAGAVGLKCVFDFHNRKGIANMYSLHSWCGITAAGIMAAQWLLAAAVFALPLAPQSVRAALLPLHRGAGLAALLLAVAACLTGVTEKNIFVGNYPSLPAPAVLSNCIGLLLAAFGLLLLHLLSCDAYRQDGGSEDERMPLSSVNEEAENSAT